MASVHPTQWERHDLQLWLAGEFANSWETFDEALEQGGITDGPTLWSAADTVVLDLLANDEQRALLLYAMQLLKETALLQDRKTALTVLAELEPESAEEVELFQQVVDDRLCAVLQSGVSGDFEGLYEAHVAAVSSASATRPSSLWRPAGERTCTVCTQDDVEIVVGSDDCACAYCHACLSETFKRAMRGEFYLPLRCCGDGSVFDLRTVALVASPEKLAIYRRRVEERRMRKPLYCPAKGCVGVRNMEAFGDTLPAEVSCGLCHTVICTSCKSETHGDTKCMPADDDEMAAELCAGPNRQRCPQCKIVVEREFGCNKMHCTVPSARATSASRVARRGAQHARVRFTTRTPPRRLLGRSRTTTSSTCTSRACASTSIVATASSASPRRQATSSAPVRGATTPSPATRGSAKSPAAGLGSACPAKAISQMCKSFAALRLARLKLLETTFEQLSEQLSEQ